MPEDATELADLKSKARLIPFFLVEMTPTPRWDGATREERERVLRRHLLWQQDLEQRGVVVLAGPVDQDVTPGHGLAVLRAATRQEATEIAESEPFHLAGLRHNQVRTWMVNEGCLTVTIRLFDDHVELT